MLENELLVGVMPAYNEELNIQKTAVEWYLKLKECDENALLIVVDDGSKDKTHELTHDLQTQYPNIIAVSKQNGGHGSAVLYGYTLALKLGATWIFQTDSDGQTSPIDFNVLWENRNNYDTLFGIRVVRKDGNSRIFVTNVLKKILQIIFRINAIDTNTPYRLMNRNALIEGLNIIIHNNLPNIQLNVFFEKTKKKMFYFPIVFEQRNAGKNSINLKKIVKIGICAIKDFFELNNRLKKERFTSH